MDKDFKKLLKEAKEALVNREFDRSIQLCKEVLKADRDNYLALVFLGASMQETDQYLLAPKAFQKAVILKPDQILAWQGLASYYNKDGVEKNYDHMVNVYYNMMNLESDSEKWCGFFNNFVEAVMKTDRLESLLQYVNIQKEGRQAANLRVFWQGVTTVLKNTKCHLEREHYDVMFEGFLFLQQKKAARKELFNILFLQNDLENLVHYAMVFNLDIRDIDLINLVLNVYGRIYVEQQGRITSILRNWVAKVVNQFTSNELNDSQLLCKATVLMDTFNFEEARDLLEGYLTPENKSFWQGHILLGIAHLKLLCYEEAELRAKLAWNCKSESKNSYAIDLVLLQAIVHSQNEEKTNNGLILGEKLLKSSPDDAIIVECMARGNIKLKNWEAAEPFIKKLEDSEAYKMTASLLRIEMAKLKNEPDYFYMLQSSSEKYPDSAELCYLLGMHYMKEDKLKEGINSLFKAAKLAPHWYPSFLELGVYFKNCNDLERARRCLKKALYLNRRSDEVAAALSDVFRAQKDEEANKELLNAIAKNTGSKWAWLQLGIQYSTENEIELAIKCLRSAIRQDPTDSVCWEVLADSYLARGSYTSAMKSYQKVLEHKPGSWYPAVQIASIKLLVGEPEESRKEFKQLVLDSPKNVLVLKGLTEACIGSAKNHLSRRLLGLARDCLEEAISAVSSALTERRDLSCLWKLMGDVLIQAALLPKSWSFLEVPVWINDKDTNIDKELKIELKTLALCELSTRCYLYALRLVEEIGTTSSLWHDLAASYYHQAELSKNVVKRKQLMHSSFSAIKKSLSLDGISWEHWNLLGVIASSPDINEKPLAQHAFIQSIMGDDRNSVAWTNLGVLYLELNNSDLANKAFKATQRIDDSYYQSWIGQAMIAEKIKHVDTLDLFRHTTQLGFHPESAISYAQHVLYTLKMEITSNDDREYYNDSIKSMFAEVVASEGMTWYSEERDSDSCGWNMLGCLQERLGWLNSSIKSFSKALSLLEKERENYSVSKKKIDEDELQKILISQRVSIVQKNLVRVFLNAGRNKEAISIFNQIEESDFQTDCNLALAFFNADELDESIRQYERITTKYSLHNGKHDKLADILIAKAAAYYKKDDADATFDNLKQCRMLRENSKIQSANGLFAEFAFHILESDLDSAKEVLELVKPLKRNPAYITDITTFDAYASFIEEDYNKMIWTLAKSVINQPGLASLRLKLAILIVEKHFTSDSNNLQLVEAAARLAKLSVKLGMGTDMNVRKVLPIASVAHLLSGNLKESLVISQHAVHLYPNIAEGWSVFLASAAALKYSDVILKNIISHLRNKLYSSSDLADWVNSIEAQYCS